MRILLLCSFIGVSVCQLPLIDEPSRCETCVLLGKEFDSYVMKNKRTETSLVEALETICEKMLEYKVHKDKEGLDRFQRVDSKTMETLKELRDKGVQVDLGMPYELWDKPSAEITELKQICELIVENYEDAIESWYWKMGWNFAEGVCRERVLKGGDVTCIPDPPNTEL